MATFPLGFQENIQKKLAAEAPQFYAALSETPPVSLRINPHKKKDIPSTWQPIPWTSQGYYLPERPIFTLDPSLHAGAYYVQEASSMLVEQVFRQHISLEKPLKILDLCAAPGGKSTQIAALMNEQSLLIANEVIKTRNHILLENLQKWGNPNVLVSQHDPADFAKLQGFFDVILVDAPCSGEGLFRKDKDAIGEWSPQNVALCCARQKRIVADVLPALAPNGILIYSTCTYNDQENEGNAAWLLENFELAPLALNLPTTWGIQQTGIGYQCFPHRVRGEGFYMAVFQNNGELATPKKGNLGKQLGQMPAKETQFFWEWLSQSEAFDFYINQYEDIFYVRQSLQNSYLQIKNVLSRINHVSQFGTFKGKDFIPHHALALSWFCSRSLPQLHLSKAEALDFLSKNPLALQPSSEYFGKYVLMCCEDLPLGWAKILPNRINNYYPSEWRIKMKH